VEAFKLLRSENVVIAIENYTEIRQKPYCNPEQGKQSFLENLNPGSLEELRSCKLRTLDLGNV
jgi:hypothetical protein